MSINLGETCLCFLYTNPCADFLLYIPCHKLEDTKAEDVRGGQEKVVHHMRVYSEPALSNGLHGTQTPVLSVFKVQILFLSMLSYWQHLGGANGMYPLVLACYDLAFLVAAPLLGTSRSYLWMCTDYLVSPQKHTTSENWSFSVLLHLTHCWR